MTDKVYVLLGTNIGDKLKNLEAARLLIEKSVGIIRRSSKIYETEAWGKTDQPSFYNQVVCLTTSLSPEILLSTLLDIETRIGRVRYEKWGERIIDIDILYYGSHTINKSELHVPHAEIQNRRFTLVPLVEIAKNFLHPILGKTSEEMLEDCPDTLNVEPVGLPLENI